MAFTIQSTLLLGLVLVFLTYLVYLVFKKMKVELNNNLLIGILLWVVLASFVRIFEDAGIYPTHFLTTTPGIIMLFATLFLPILWFGRIIEKKTKFALWKTLSVSAIIGIAIHVPFFRIINAPGALAILLLFSFVLFLMFFTNKIVKASAYAFWALAAHLFDASTTFVSMQFYGYSEQHVLPSLLIDVFGPAVMFPLKLIFLVPVIYVINKYSEDDYLKKLLLLAIFSIGMAPAIRGLLRLCMGV